jgi:hypothetical protein
MPKENRFSITDYASVDCGGVWMSPPSISLITESMKRSHPLICLRLGGGVYQEEETLWAKQGCLYFETLLFPCKGCVLLFMSNLGVNSL